MRRFDSPYEHSIIFNRTDGERDSPVMGKGHHPEVTLTVSTEVYENESPDRERMTLSYAEARLLRDLLNAAQLDQE
ncbi:MAG TPA: hypothetical protein VF043_30230 [Ktedonobacteraceae bacterium]